MDNHIVTISETKNLFASQKRKVLVGGCFDILHIGHIKFLNRSKQQGDVLIVALESDDFINIHKKRNPFHTQEERTEMLLSLRAVDYVIPLPLFTSDRDYNALVVNVFPQIIAVTQGDVNITKKKSHAKKVGALVKIVMPLYRNISTTEFLKNIDKKPSIQEA